MKLNVTFARLHPEYSQEYANEYEFGKESLSKSKVIWEMSFQTENVIKYSIKKNQVFHLKILKEENEFNFPIEKMTILNCILENGEQIQYAISDELMENATNNSNVEKQNTANIYFYLNDQKFIKPYHGIYIAANDFPKE